MNTDRFKTWIAENEIIEKTKKSFWENFRRYKKENPNEFSKDFGEVDERDVRLVLRGVDLRIMDWDYKYIDTVVSILQFEIKRVPTGVYKLIFDLHGIIMDDVFYEKI